MSTTAQPQQEKNRDKIIAAATTWTLHIVVLLFMIFFTMPQPEKVDLSYGNGIAVNFGNVEESSGNDKLVVDEDAAGPREDKVNTPVDNSTPTPTEKTDNKSVAADNDEAAIRKKEEDKKKQADADRRKAADAERKRQEDEAKAASDALKGALGKGGKGGNRGTGKDGAGQQGAKDGQVTDVFGLGLGTIRGKISNRGIRQRPNLNGAYQTTGTVVISVCIDKAGNVISAEYSSKGSSTNDDDLVRAAKKFAKEYKFEANALASEQECGDLPFEFKLR